MSRSSGSITFSGDISTSIESSSLSKSVPGSGVIPAASSGSVGVCWPSATSSPSSSLRKLGPGDGSAGYSCSGSGVASLSRIMSTSGFLVQLFKCSQKSDHLKNSAQHLSQMWVSSLPLRLSFPLSASSAISPETGGKKKQKQNVFIYRDFNFRSCFTLWVHFLTSDDTFNKS